MLKDSFFKWDHILTQVFNICEVDDQDPYYGISSHTFRVNALSQVYDVFKPRFIAPSPSSCQ